MQSLWQPSNDKEKVAEQCWQAQAGWLAASGTVQTYLFHCLNYSPPSLPKREERVRREARKQGYKISRTLFLPLAARRSFPEHHRVVQKGHAHSTEGQYPGKNGMRGPFGSDLWVPLVRTTRYMLMHLNHREPLPTEIHVACMGPG